MALKVGLILLIQSFYTALPLLAIVFIAFLIKTAYQYGLKKAAIPNIISNGSFYAGTSITTDHGSDEKNINIIDVDHGTGKWLSLPPQLKVTKIPATELNLHGINILVVDDNKMNLLIASRFLKKWQANVDEAINGQLAVNMAAIKNYDLIIMDLQMPVMDGFEATALIKKINPEIPVIALTADMLAETYNKAIAAGMSDYITKPFVPAMFFEKVSAYCKVAISQ